jgi:transcriptional regulator with XRE-family HTH domain
MHDFKKIVGKRVKTARKNAGLTQEQLAEKIDKTVETVSNIERGIKLPRLATLEDLRKALNVKLSELVDVVVE